MRRQLVGGVAEQGHAPLRPPAERRTMEQAPAMAHRLRGDHLDDCRMPAGKVAQLLTLGPRHHPVASGPRGRMALHQQKVDVVVAHRIVQQMAARPHPELQRSGSRQARQHVHRHDAAEPAAPGVQRVVVAEHPASHERTRAVGADDEVGLRRAAVPETQHGACARVVDSDQALVQLNAIESGGRGQDRLEVGAMNPEVWRRRSAGGRTARPGARQ